MRGEMLWFNEEKGHGFIRTEDGERLYVHRTGFVGSRAPVGRCAGLAVIFEREEDREGSRAVDASLVELVEPRRARLRRGHGSRG
ncbi:MAG: cold shock domain-containing protein [Gaiellaceae bacterium]